LFELETATLKMSILEEIVKDHAPLCAIVKKVGVTGSFARGEDYTEASDIDLVVDIEGEHFDKEALWVAERIRKILMDQFRKKVDFIKYDTIIDRKDTPSNFYIQKGYRKMYEDLIWLWRKEDELYK